jgi:acyl-CoA synthetase (AMP-forming)/AMP-acid ligase II
LTPLDFKRRAVQLFGNKIGVIDGDRRFTYREFGERTDALASALLQRGARPGDRIACMDSTPPRCSRPTSVSWQPAASCFRSIFD